MSAEILINTVTRLYELIDHAHASDELEPKAAALATTDGTTGQPSVSTIYVHIQRTNIVLFVNAASGKGRQLKWDPTAALCFFWRHLAQQVTLEGRVERLDDEASDTLWQRRSHDSALVARVSRQHAHQGNEAALKTHHQIEKRRYSFTRAPRPANWIAYRVLPERIEFWETGWQRMRMRYLYERLLDGQWQIRAQEP